MSRVASATALSPGSATGTNRKPRTDWGRCAGIHPRDAASATSTGTEGATRTPTVDGPSPSNPTTARTTATSFSNTHYRNFIQITIKTVRCVPTTVMRWSRIPRQHRTARHHTSESIRGTVGLLAVLAGTLVLATWPVATVGAVSGALVLRAALRRCTTARPADGRETRPRAAAEACADPR